MKMGAIKKTTTANKKIAVATRPGVSGRVMALPLRAWRSAQSRA
jgi:hypothetical protein